MPRILFSVLEKENGELILVSKTAERTKPNGPVIREQRFSVHPSQRSPIYTTVKQTLNTADGKSETSVMLTDAVKRKAGFSILYARRVQNLDEDRYTIGGNRKHKLNVLADYDPSFYSLYFAVFLGHPDAPFEARTDGVVVSHFRFRSFKLLVLASLDAVPSHYSTHYATAVTFPPEVSKQNEIQDALRFQMTGRPPEACLHQYVNSVKLLTRLYWETAIQELDDPALIQFARERIAEVSDVEMTAIELGTGLTPTHMLSGGKPPNLR